MHTAAVAVEGAGKRRKRWAGVLTAAIVAAGCAGRNGVAVDDLASGPAATPSTGAPSTGAGPARGPGTYDESLRTADGRTRTYRSVIPPAGEGSARPLVLGLHGGLGWGTQFEQSSGLDALAAAEGVVMVYPDGVGSPLAPERTRTWNAGLCCGPAVAQQVDDVAFLRQVIDAVSSTTAIDPARVFVIGHSNGAMMGYRLACELADRVAAVAVQAGNLGLTSCRPVAPVALLHLHGDADTNVPIGGGSDTTGIAGVDYPPVIDGLRTIAAADGCPEPPATGPDPTNGDLRITTWRGCSGGTEVRYVEVHGATHAWMGRPTRLSGAVGDPFMGLDASAVALDFVLAHPRR